LTLFENLDVETNSGDCLDWFIVGQHGQKCGLPTEKRRNRKKGSETLELYSTTGWKQPSHHITRRRQWQCSACSAVQCSAVQYSTHLFSSPITTMSSFLVQKISSNFVSTAPMVIYLNINKKENLQRAEKDTRINRVKRTNGFNDDDDDDDDGRARFRRKTQKLEIEEASLLA
jgi:hypothetical protein